MQVGMRQPHEQRVMAVEHLSGSDAEVEEMEASYNRSSIEPSPMGPPRAPLTDTTAPPRAGSGTIRWTAPPQQRQVEGQASHVATVAATGNDYGNGGRAEDAATTSTIAHNDGSNGSGAAPPPPPPPQAPSFISAADYSDRQRLLYHITHLSTQLQRAQLQLQNQDRTITILHAATQEGGRIHHNHNRNTSGASGIVAAAADASATTIVLPSAAESTAAAVLAARTTAEVRAALGSSLALFDPLLAQEAIYRLDDALAQLGLLREAELGRLEAAEGELAQLRGERMALAGRVDHLASVNATLSEENERMRDGFEGMRLEVERLRLGEVRLVRKVAGLEGLIGDGGGVGVGVGVVTGGGGYDSYYNYPGQHQQQYTGGNGGSGGSASVVTVSLHFERQQRTLMEAEAAARQTLTLGIFWDPMVIAFDAGVTWIGDSAQLCQRLQQVQAEQDRISNADGTGGGDGSDGNGNTNDRLQFEAGDADGDALLMAMLPPYRQPPRSTTQRNSNRNTDSRRKDGRGAPSSPSSLPPLPPTDADLLLMRSQQDEIISLQSQLALHRERLRVAQLDGDRLRSLCEGERRRSEGLAADHGRQLEAAYAEVMKDRSLLAERLRAEVEAQVRGAFRDGRRFERHRHAEQSKIAGGEGEGGGGARRAPPATSQSVDGGGGGGAQSLQPCGKSPRMGSSGGPALASAPRPSVSRAAATATASKPSSLRLGINRRRSASSGNGRKSGRGAAGGCDGYSSSSSSSSAAQPTARR